MSQQWRLVRRMALQRLLVALSLVTGATGKCPNWCSQHGICTSPHDDAICVCEMGYAGDGCEIRLCPKGDDPLTEGQGARTIRITTSTTAGRLSGTFGFTFNGETVTFPADSAALPGDAFAGIVATLPNVAKAAAVRGVVNPFSGGTSYILALEAFPTIPWENNLFAHDGNPPLSAFGCKFTTAVIAETAEMGETPAIEPLEGARCDLEDVVTDNVREYAECSRHGRCDGGIAACICEPGFKGVACDDITDADDIEVLEALGPFFTGSVLRLAAARGAGKTHRLLSVSTGNAPLLTLDGAGDVTLHRGRLFVGGESGGVITGGFDGFTSGSSRMKSGYSDYRSDSTALLVGSGDLELRDGSLRAAALFLGGGRGTASKEEAVAAAAMATTGSRGAIVLDITAPATAAVADVLFRVLAAGGDEAVAVLGDGALRLRNGQLVLESGGLFQTSGDSSFSGSMDVAGQLRVAGGGVAIAAGGGISLADGTLSVTSSGSNSTTTSVGSSSSEAAIVAAIRSVGASFNGSVLALSTASTGFEPAFSAGSEAESDNGDVGPYLLRASAGSRPVLDIPASGPIRVGSGGVTVAAGGLAVGAGGISVGSGGIDVEGGFKLKSGIFELESSEGLRVATGGITAVSSDATAPALTAEASAAGFGGSILRLAAPRHPAGGSTFARGSEVHGGSLARGSSFNFIEAVAGSDAGGGRGGGKDEELSSPFAVRGDGKVTAAGGLLTGSQGVVEAGGGLVCGGAAVLSRIAVAAGESILVPAAAGPYVEIIDDGVAAANRISFGGSLGDVSGGKGRSTEAGQVLVVRNNDAQATTGAAVIPQGYTVIFVYDGSAWRDLRALEAASAALHNVTAFTAAADLDIGDFTLRAKHLAAAGNRPGRVAVYGGGGVLAAHEGLLWDGASAMLSVARLRASEMASDLDFRGFAARNLALVNVTVAGLQSLRTERIFLSSAAAAIASATSKSSGGRNSISLAGFGPRGELVAAASGASVDVAGVLSVTALNGHAVRGEVDFGGNVLRGAALEGVRSLSGLQRLEVGTLAVAALAPPVPPSSSASGDTRKVIVCGGGRSGQIEACGGIVPTMNGGLSLNGILSAAAIVLQPTASVRGVAASGTGEVGGTSSGGDGMLAVVGEGGELRAAAGPVLHKGVLHNATLAGAAFVGDVDMGGHRLLNVKIDASDLPPPPEASSLTHLTVTGQLKLPTAGVGGGSGTVERLLVADENGHVVAAGAATLALRAATLSADAVAAAFLNITGLATISGGLNLGGSELSGVATVTAATIAAESLGAEMLTVRDITAASLSGFALRGPIDAAGHDLRNVRGISLAPGHTVIGLDSLEIGHGGLRVAGSLAVGADASVKGSLTVDGVVMGAGPYVDSSDARLKTSIAPLDSADALRVVRALRGVTYQSIADVDAAGSGGGGSSSGGGGKARRQLGFLAQELEKILPELVYEDFTGYRAVAYARLAPVLAAALGEVARSHELLERRVAELQVEVSGLRAAKQRTAEAAAASVTARRAATAGQTSVGAVGSDGEGEQINAAILTLKAKGVNPQEETYFDAAGTGTAAEIRNRGPSAREQDFESRMRLLEVKVGALLRNGGLPAAGGVGAAPAPAAAAA